MIMSSYLLRFNSELTGNDISLSTDCGYYSCSTCYKSIINVVSILFMLIAS